jgi:hypothetical protein
MTSDLLAEWNVTSVKMAESGNLGVAHIAS